MLCVLKSDAAAKKKKTDEPTEDVAEEEAKVQYFQG